MKLSQYVSAGQSVYTVQHHRQPQASTQSPGTSPPEPQAYKGLLNKENKMSSLRVGTEVTLMEHGWTPTEKSTGPMFGLTDWHPPSRGVVHLLTLAADASFLPTRTKSWVGPTAGWHSWLQPLGQSRQSASEPEDEASSFSHLIFYFSLFHTVSLQVSVFPLKKNQGKFLEC